jgi:hypothetical protein
MSNDLKTISVEENNLISSASASVNVVEEL